MGWPKGKPRRRGGGTATLELPDPVKWVRTRVRAVLGDDFKWSVERETGRERVEIVVDNREEEICGQIAFIDIQKMRVADEHGMHEGYFRDRLNDFMNEGTVL